MTPIIADVYEKNGLNDYEKVSEIGKIYRKYGLTIDGYAIGDWRIQPKQGFWQEFLDLFHVDSGLPGTVFTFNNQNQLDGCDVALLCDLRKYLFQFPGKNFVLSGEKDGKLQISVDSFEAARELDVFTKYLEQIGVKRSCRIL